MKRYNKKGGKIVGEGKNQKFEKSLGEEIAKKTVQHMIDHLGDEAKAEELLSDNQSSVADIHQTIALLQKFI